MLKLNSLVMFLILIITNGNCQTKNDDDRVNIHKQVIDLLRNEGEKFYVYPFTKKGSFSSFDFAGGGRGLDINSNRA